MGKHVGSTFVAHGNLPPARGILRASGCAAWIYSIVVWSGFGIDVCLQLAFVCERLLVRPLDAARARRLVVVVFVTEVDVGLRI